MYEKFLRSIKNCSDNRLDEIINEAIKERQHRQDHYKSIKDLSEKISKLESDW